jgi:hypothetical protein
MLSVASRDATTSPLYVQWPPLCPMAGICLRADLDAQCITLSALRGRKRQRSTQNIWLLHGGWLNGKSEECGDTKEGECYEVNRAHGLGLVACFLPVSGIKK